MRQAAEDHSFVRIDMEDSSTTDDTLRLYRELREAGHENVGVVLQAYLRRTLDDIHALADLRPNVRLCKGIYVEPSSIAFTDDDAIRASFVECLDALLDAHAYVGVATHDEWLIGEALRIVGERGLERDELRAPDAARRARAAGERARRRGASAARLRPVRRAVVCVLAPPSPGEPRDGGHDRPGDHRTHVRPGRLNRPALRGVRYGYDQPGRARRSAPRGRRTLGDVEAARRPGRRTSRRLRASRCCGLRTSQADRRTRTCNARGSNRQASRVEKQLAPVACEQPPRSKVILTINGGLFGSGR